MTRKKQKERKLPFSQRYGFKPIKNKIQFQSMDNDLRIGLWNALRRKYWDYSANFQLKSSTILYSFIKRIWEDFFKKPIENIAPGNWYDNLKIIRKQFFEYSWYEVYDFIEFIAENGPKNQADKFRSYCNNILEKEVSAYRFVNDTIAPITSEVELTEIEEALERSKPYHPVHLHLQTALDYLADRKEPDYRNSIKESISAIESIVKTLTDSEKGTLGRILPKLKLHPDLEEAFQKLYGWTSDAEGIRHALMEAPTLGLEDAIFMLVVCSAFFNYLIAKCKS